MNQRDLALYVSAFLPQDLAAGNVLGRWISLANYNHIEFIVHKAAGASGEPPTLTFEQAQDSAGTGAKALNFPQYSQQNAADITTLTGYTNVTQTPTNTVTPAAGNTQSLTMVEFDAQNLDVTNNYKFVRARIPDVGTTAQLAGCIARLSEARGGSTVNPFV
jgi:hypothetical protein